MARNEFVGVCVDGSERGVGMMNKELDCSGLSNILVKKVLIEETGCEKDRSTYTYRTNN